MPSTLSAVIPAERSPALDVLRGFALMGVLIVNIYDWLGKPATPLDTLAHGFVELFFENKSWPLLSFLFGLGFSLQIQRAIDTGQPVFLIHFRRMAALYAAGVLLMALFAGNPVLVRYAAAGIFLLPAAYLRPKTIAILAGLFFVVSVADRFVYQAVVQQNRPRAAGTASPQQPPRPAPQQPPTLLANTVRVLQRVPLMPSNLGFWPGRQTEIFTMFLLGLYAGKRRLHEEIASRRRGLVRFSAAAIAIGLAGSAAALMWTVPPADPLAVRVTRRVITLATGDLQSLGYAAWIAVAATAETLGHPLRFWAACGRMPLTNYLGQWMIMRLIFDRYFFALGGTLGPAAGLAIAVAIYGFQGVLTSIWLQRWNYGPAEFVWKWFTYLRRPGLRSEAERQAAAAAG